jgi:hypothetical protein
MMLTLSQALTNFEPFVAQLQRSPTTRDAKFEAAWIGLLGACERAAIGLDRQTIRCIREHAQVVREGRLQLIRDAKVAEH